MDDVLGKPARGRRAVIGEESRRCTAHNKSGQRCGKAPVPGGFVCSMHGGNVPAVREAAKRRLLRMVDPVLSVFEEILDSWHRTTCPACGKPTGDTAPVIRVGQLVLDRAGFHPSVDVTVRTEQSPFAELLQWLPTARLELMQQWMIEAADARQRGAVGQLREGDAIDVDLEPTPITPDSIP